MENQNDFEDKNRQEPIGMSNNQQNDSAKNNVFSEAGAEDADIGPVNETEHILPEEDEGDNRFMDNEEEIDNPLSSGDELEDLEEPVEDEDFSEFDEEEE